MAFSRRLTCEFCSVGIFSRQALPGRDPGGAAVCRRCYAEWVRQGKLCAGCQGPVVEAQEVGIFVERESFGHEECGGVLLTLSPSRAADWSFRRSSTSVDTAPITGPVRDK